MRSTYACSLKEIFGTSFEHISDYNRIVENIPETSFVTSLESGVYDEVEEFFFLLWEKPLERFYLRRSEQECLDMGLTKVKTGESYDLEFYTMIDSEKYHSDANKMNAFFGLELWDGEERRKKFWFGYWQWRKNRIREENFAIAFPISCDLAKVAGNSQKGGLYDVLEQTEMDEIPEVSENGELRQIGIIPRPRPVQPRAVRSRSPPRYYRGAGDQRSSRFEQQSFNPIHALAGVIFGGI